MNLLPQLEHDTVKASDVSDQGVHKYQCIIEKSHGSGTAAIKSSRSGRSKVVQRPEYGNSRGQKIARLDG